MPLELTWQDIALRLALTLAAGALIGFNREAHGHAAGLRTTMLVCLAASVAMVLANLLLSTGGKTPESFVQMDMMRLPLGVLTGVGFIGGGAILRRGDLVTGVTTAATLWMVTMIGLCFGAGAIELGVAATALSLIIIWALHWVDGQIAHDQAATLLVSGEGAMPSLSDLRKLINASDCRVQLQAQTQSRATGENVSRYHISWRSSHRDEPPIRISDLLQRWPEVARAEWETEVVG
jgi:putative Mg2+ transporter-C (MgtC) family protein